MEKAEVIQAENRGMLWIIGAFVFCPCHLPLTLGLLGILLSGTAAGVLLADHWFVAGAIVSVVWLAGTIRGILYLRQASRCERTLEGRPGDQRAR